MNGYKDVVELLIAQKECDINAIDNNGYTALHKGTMACFSFYADN